MGTKMVKLETNASPQAPQEMTSADNIKFVGTYSPWSRAGSDGYTIQPWGIDTGGVCTPAISGGNDVIDVAAMSLVMPGASAADADGMVAVTNQTDVAVARPAGNDFLVSSVTVSEAGTLTVIGGTAGTALSTVRGASGGPPFIPVDSVEVSQVLYTSQTPAPVTTNEIRQVPGVSQELTSYPVISKESAIEGYIEFSQSLPLNHTGGIPKKVVLNGALAVTAEVPKSRNYVPPETTVTSNSETFYDTAIAFPSFEASQGSFEVALKDGVTDWIVAAAARKTVLIVEFYPDRDKLDRIVAQGFLGQSRTFPADGANLATYSITPDEPAVSIPG